MWGFIVTLGLVLSSVASAVDVNLQILPWERASSHQNSVLEDEEFTSFQEWYFLAQLNASGILKIKLSVTDETGGSFKQERFLDLLWDSNGAAVARSRQSYFVASEIVNSFSKRVYIEADISKENFAESLVDLMYEAFKTLVRGTCQTYPTFAFCELPTTKAWFYAFIQSYFTISRPAGLPPVFDGGNQTKHESGLGGGDLGGSGELFAPPASMTEAQGSHQCEAASSDGAGLAGWVNEGINLVFPLDEIKRAAKTCQMHGPLQAGVNMGTEQLGLGLIYVDPELNHIRCTFQPNCFYTLKLYTPDPHNPTNDPDKIVLDPESLVCAVLERDENADDCAVGGTSTCIGDAPGKCVPNEPDTNYGNCDPDINWVYRFSETRPGRCVDQLCYNDLVQNGQEHILEFMRGCRPAAGGCCDVRKERCVEDGLICVCEDCKEEELCGDQPCCDKEKGENCVKTKGGLSFCSTAACSIMVPDPNIPKEYCIDEREYDIEEEMCMVPLCHYDS